MKHLLTCFMLLAFLMPSMLFANDKSQKDTNSIYEYGKDLKRARILDAGKAVYPESPVLTEDVDCVFLTVISENGSATEMEPVRYTHTVYDDAAKQAIQSTKFSPATLKDRPVATRLFLRVIFHADKSEAIVDPLEYKKDDALKPPKMINNYGPQFADYMRTNKMEGEVVVSFLIGTDGKPVGVHVVHHLCGVCDANALDAIKQFRFQPATVNGQPVLFPLTVVLHI